MSMPVWAWACSVMMRDDGDAHDEQFVGDTIMNHRLDHGITEYHFAVIAHGGIVIEMASTSV